MEDRAPIVIRRIRKKKHDAHHGGSWKVAYADFVTAMMAFFLLLWLITMVSPDKRQAVSEYFKNFNVFKEQTTGGRSFMDKNAAVLTLTSQAIRLGPQDLVAKLKKAVDEKLGSLKDQVQVDILEGGVRIQIIDLEGSTMFESGSSELTQKARTILNLVAENIRDLPNRIAVEGHTDAAPFRDSRITNWELSTARASAARREMENDGIDPGRIARVVGYADQELYIRENPKDPRNRRISVIVLQQKEGTSAGPAAAAPTPGSAIPIPAATEVGTGAPPNPGLPPSPAHAAGTAPAAAPR
jgi:chemotaxis protein MotB